jgi:hypothetical protein
MANCAASVPVMLVVSVPATAVPVLVMATLIDALFDPTATLPNASLDTLLLSTGKPASKLKPSGMKPSRSTLESKLNAASGEPPALLAEKHPPSCEKAAASPSISVTDRQNLIAIPCFDIGPPYDLARSFKLNSIRLRRLAEE